MGLMTNPEMALVCYLGEDDYFFLKGVHRVLSIWGVCLLPSRLEALENHLKTLKPNGFTWFLSPTPALAEALPLLESLPKLEVTTKSALDVKFLLYLDAAGGF